MELANQDFCNVLVPLLKQLTVLVIQNGLSFGTAFSRIVQDLTYKYSKVLCRIKKKNESCRIIITHFSLFLMI